MALQKKTYPVHVAGTDALKTVTFTVGQSVRTIVIAGRTFHGKVSGLGRLYISIDCTDGQLRSLYPHQIEAE